MDLAHPEPGLVALMLLPGFIGLFILGKKQDTQKEGKKMKDIKKTINRIRNGGSEKETPGPNPAALPPIPKWPKRIFWASVIAAGVASLGHVAHQFGALEPAGPFPLLYHFSIISGLLAAVAVDITLVAVTWYIGRARRYDLPTGRMWLLIMLLTGISMFANAGHAFEVLIDGPVTLNSIAALDPYNRLRAILLSATLPLIAIGMGSIAEEAGFDWRDLAREQDAGDAMAPGAPAVDASSENGHQSEDPIPPSDKEASNVRDR